MICMCMQELSNQPAQGIVNNSNSQMYDMMVGHGCRIAWDRRQQLPWMKSSTVLPKMKASIPSRARSEKLANLPMFATVQSNPVICPVHSVHVPVAGQSNVLSSSQRPAEMAMSRKGLVVNFLDLARTVFVVY